MNGCLRAMIGLSLIRLLLDGLLPEGDAARYADLGLSLAMMLCILGGLMGLLRGTG